MSKIDLADFSVPWRGSMHMCLLSCSQSKYEIIPRVRCLEAAMEAVASFRDQESGVRVPLYRRWERFFLREGILRGLIKIISRSG